MTTPVVDPAPGPPPATPGPPEPSSRDALSVHRSASWWTGLSRGQRIAVVIVTAIVGFNVVLASLRSFVGGEPGGPVSSSFSTGSDGLEAYADLLRAQGHPVTRLRSSVAKTDLPTDATVVVADPDKLTRPKAVALARFVEGGGRLVVTGSAGEQLVAALSGVPISHHDRDPAARLDVWFPSADTGSARALAGDRGGRWADIGPMVPLAGDDQGPSIVAVPVGKGHLIAVADTSLLHNGTLGQADNAALALALAGERGRPVIFAESVHDAGSGGWKALPATWRYTVYGLLIALAVGLWAFGTRFGPPEPQRRELRPPRRDHVDAIAAALDQAGADTFPPDHDSPGASP